ncbi:VOC family protein [Actinoplanes sp. Pm04-4]|uniref:VOC family protein n=1 Tax=Paractinoplanes pyxinae TaxID=2997416 RepID=A0ABT4BFY3_9ACTN|nr:VOC family protein [Actinoplanes pyxinae]MCY1145431.1 VOC family protein [Actinoplanes pyxinae]
MLSEEVRRITHPVAQFDGLAIDVGDPQSQAEFWRVTLGGRVVDDGEGQLRVVPGEGRPAREILRLRKVDSPAADDARVHVDVRLSGEEPDGLIAAGATVVRRPGPDPWFVLADPEGNEFCAFPGGDDRPPGMFELVVKCSDAHRLARWWAAVLGGRVEDEGEAASVVGAPEFPWDYMVFDPVPGIDRYRGRVRWHLVGREDEPEALLEAGATVLTRPGRQQRWWMLADPEGNEFLFTPPGA